MDVFCLFFCVCLSVCLFVCLFVCLGCLLNQGKQLQKLFSVFFFINSFFQWLVESSLVPRPTPFFFLRFAFSMEAEESEKLSPCIILNTNQRTKNGAGLGTRLSQEGYVKYLVQSSKI